jgi:2-haloalkanoic acid dehalogenase type II
MVARASSLCAPDLLLSAVRSRRFVGAAPGGSRLVVARENLRGYRGLTFDGYGALLQGGPDEPPRALARVFSDQGKVVDRSVREAWQKGLRTKYAADPFVAFREMHRQLFQDLFTRYGIREDVDATVDAAFDEYRLARAHPEVSAVLRDLEKEVAMAVVSNMDTAILLEALHRNGLSFTFIVASEEEQRYKPSASMFQRAIRYLGLPPANILHVGGSYPEDVVGATSLGMGAALVDRESKTRQDSGRSVRVIQSLEELPPLIRQSWA